jgi:hypothetical protein
VFSDRDYRLWYDYDDFYASKTFYDPVKRRRIFWRWATTSHTPSLTTTVRVGPAFRCLFVITLRKTLEVMFKIKNLRKADEFNPAWLMDSLRARLVMGVFGVYFGLIQEDSFSF